MAPELLYLSRADVERIGPSMAEVVELVETVFREKGEGRAEMPPKPGIHPLPDAFLHAMPAFLPGLGAAGLKWVSGFPGNVVRGLPYIAGLLVMNDPATGLPVAVMDCTWVTAMRTGAATAVAARHLARPESASAGVFACGVQGRSNLEALAVVLPLERVRAWDPAPGVAERFAAEMGERLGLAVEPVDAPRAAVEGMDVVVTSGPILREPRPTIEAGWLASGVFASAVDFDSAFTAGALAAFDRRVTDDLPQMEHYRALGYFASTPAMDAELGALVTGRVPGRRSEEERAIAINLGIALEDVALGGVLVERARERGVGTRLSL